MKKYIINSLAGLACLIAATGCQKQNIQPETRPGNTSEQEMPLNTAGQKPTPGKKINATWSSYFRECWVMVRCNCVIMKEIVVRPKFAEELRNASSGADVVSIFQDPANAYIADELQIDQLDSLLSGRYYVSIASEKPDKVCVFAGPVKPVTESNMAFAFQYSK